MEGLWVTPPVQLAIKTGVCLAAAQLVLSALFSLPCAGFARRQPAFTAHQVVTLPFMIYVAWVGSMGWFYPTPHDLANGQTLEGRLYGRDEVGERLSALVLGAMIFWDVPCTACLPSIYSASGLGHHVALIALASICLLPYMQHYAPFFVGVIEISSIPLVFVDFFHPKHFAEIANSHAVLSVINEALRVLFALSFVVLRTVWFPIVQGLHVIPDLATQLNFSGDGYRAGLAAVGIAFGAGFTVLQWHWSYLLICQVLRGKMKPAPQTLL